MSDKKKLNQLQKMIADITAEQKEITRQLAELREQDKEKSVLFKQFFTKKLFNISVISLLQSYGLMGGKDV